MSGKKMELCEGCGTMAAAPTCSVCGSTVGGKSLWSSASPPNSPPAPSATPPIATPATAPTKITETRKIPLAVGTLVLVAAVVGIAFATTSGSDSPSNRAQAAPDTYDQLATETQQNSSSDDGADSDASANTRAPIVATTEEVFTPSVYNCPYPLSVVKDLPWGTCTKGVPVQILQYELVARGYSLVPDSYFGPETEVALMEFQRDHGLTPNGWVDFDVWRELFAGRGDLPGSDLNGDDVITPDEFYG